jgi:hypothetical protein
VDEMQAVADAVSLLANIAMAWNTAQMRSALVAISGFLDLARGANPSRFARHLSDHVPAAMSRIRRTTLEPHAAGHPLGAASGWIALRRLAQKQRSARTDPDRSRKRNVTVTYVDCRDYSAYLADRHATHTSGVLVRSKGIVLAA